MIDITKTQIEETIEALRLDHSFANNSCPVPIILERLGEIHALAIRGLETQWKPIEQAPKDGTKVLVRTNTVHDLPSFCCIAAYDSEAGWCVDELREAIEFIILSALGEPK